MTRVVKFGCRNIVANEDLAIAEMHAGWLYFNALAAVERERRWQYRNVRYRFVPGLNEMDSADAQLKEYIDANRDLIKKKRKKASVKSIRPRTVKPTKSVERAPEIDAIEEAKAWRKAMKPQLEAKRAEFIAMTAAGEKEMKDRTADRCPPGDNHAKGRLNVAVREEMIAEPEWHEAWKEVARVDLAALAMLEWVKEERKRLGLNHGTYSAVHDDVIRAGKPPKPRPDGKPRKPRMRPMACRVDEGETGIRKMGWQITGKTTWSDILRGKSNHFRVVDLTSSRDPSPVGRGGKRNPQNHDAKEMAKRERAGSGKGKRSIQQYAIARIRVGTNMDRSPVWVDVEVFLHRAIPDDAVVSWVYLVPRDGRFTLQVTINVDRPLTERAPGNGVAQVDLCWSKRDDTLACCRVNGEEVLLPASIVERLKGAKELRGSADVYFDEAKAYTLDWIKSGQAPRWFVDATPNLENWRSRRKLHDPVRRLVRESRLDIKALWEAWKQHRWAIVGRSEDRDLHTSNFAGLSDWLTTQGVTTEHHFTVWLEWWRRKDVHMTQQCDDIRESTLRRRKDFYRCMAAKLRVRFERCEVREIDLAALAMRDLPEAKTKELHQAARAQRVLVAPYEIKEALKNIFGPDYRERSGDAKKTGTARKGIKDAVLVSDPGLAAE